MNFFEHQDQARKRTGLLIFLFILAVITLIVMTTLLVAAFFGVIGAEQGQTAQSFVSQLNPQNFGMVSLGVLGVVGGGTLFKLSQLSGGGKVVAQMMGGTLVDFNTATTSDERKLLNIVQEMAIASGTPVPPVYVMQEERGINAFAAGFKNSDAVIGVTRGCIEALNRDELQGVIAHEFSHILHGDMRINIRVMGILHGILIIGLIGYQLIDKMWYMGSSRRDNNNGAIGIIALAVGLIVIGFGGIFFGNLIKAAVSRQREYLADASAVQFTRNPDGIANALKKIGGYSHSTMMHNSNTEEASHMLFGAGTKRLVGGLFATHPPLHDRIRRIDKQWDGKFLAPEPEQPKQESKTEKPSARDALDKLTGAAAAAILAEQALNNIGNPQPEHIEQAQETIEGLPDDWHQLAQDKLGARAVIYALLIDNDANIAQHQYHHIQNLDADSLQITQQLQQTRSQLEDEYRLALVDIALPQLGKMHSERFEEFSQLVDALIRADQRISLFEWCLFAILMHYLKPLRTGLSEPESRYRDLESVKNHCQKLFSILAIAGNTAEQREAAFNAARDKADLPTLTMLPAKALGITQMNDSLEELNKLYPLAKPKLLKACVACICADGEITTTEAELIRAIGDTLDCPIPPIKL